MTIKEIIEDLQINGNGNYNITGIMSIVNGSYGLIQDDTAGLIIRYYDGIVDMYPELALGNEVSFNAGVTEYYGIYQIVTNAVLGDLTLISTDNIIEPIEVVDEDDYINSMQRLSRFTGIVSEVNVDNQGGSYPYIQLYNEELDLHAWTYGSYVLTVKDKMSQIQEGMEVTIISGIYPRIGITTDMGYLVTSIDGLQFGLPKFRQIGNSYIHTDSTKISGYRLVSDETIQSFINNSETPELNVIYYSNKLIAVDILAEVEQIRNQLNSSINTVQNQVYSIRELPTILSVKQPYEYSAGRFESLSIYDGEGITEDPTDVLLVNGYNPSINIEAIMFRDSDSQIQVTADSSFIRGFDFSGTYFIRNSSNTYDIGQGHLHTFYVSGEIYQRGSLWDIPDQDPLIQRSFVETYVKKHSIKIDREEDW